jgi:hypothetical protein
MLTLPGKMLAFAAALAVVSNAPNGSSNRINRGRSTKVRAMQTRCRIPPESCTGYASAKSSRPMNPIA